MMTERQTVSATVNCDRVEMERQSGSPLYYGDRQRQRSAVKTRGHLLQSVIDVVLNDDASDNHYTRHAVETGHNVSCRANMMQERNAAWLVHSQKLTH